MDIYARRRARLALLVEKMSQGNIAEFARKYDYSRSQVSQFLSETYNGGRSIGERAARTIDERVGNPPGWLDLELSKQEEKVLSLPFSTAELRVATDRTQPIDSSPSAPYLARIPVIAEVMTDASGLVEVYEPTKPWNQRYLDYYSAQNLFAVQIKGTGLRPRIKNGDFFVAEDGSWAQPGDEVFVLFKDQSRAVLQFLYEREGEHAFGSIIDGALSLTVKDEAIEAMGVIIAIFNRFAKTHAEEA
jgi:SOS-response transcriptional repressor LexA